MNNRILHAARRFAEELPAIRPAAVFVLGSGWGAAMPPLDIRTSIPYSAIPGLGSTCVTGHDGQLDVAASGDGDVLVFRGRRHWYEGQGWEPIAVPILIAATLQARVAVITNAAGGIRRDLRPGDLMLVDDHINMMATTPLVGPHDPAWGPRFVDQSQVYDRALAADVRRRSTRRRLALKRGVYLAVQGPAYETPAEIRAFGAIGADAVGMSTVPEAMLANAAGLRVLALSCIANRTGAGKLSHEEVVAVVNAATPRMCRLLSLVLEAIGAATSSPPPPRRAGRRR